VGANQTAGGWNIGAAEYGGTAEQNAAMQMAQNAMGTGRSIADLMTGGAAAQAAGKVGAANAWNQGLGGVANAAGNVGNYFTMKQFMNPATAGPSMSTLWNLPQTGRGVPSWMMPTTYGPAGSMPYGMY